MVVMNVIVLGVIILVFVSLDTFTVYSIEFDRKFIGINFSPYVKNVSHSSLNYCPNDITPDEMRTMLQIVATKFSRLSTETVGAWNVTYVANQTYYSHSCIIARTAEVAATINKENQNKTLSVLIGIMTSNNKSENNKRTMTELKVALEAELIANSIYPGTVEGFQIFLEPTLANNSEMVSLYLEWIHRLRNLTAGKNLTIGVFTEVKDFKSFHLNQNFDGLFGTEVLLKMLDFVNIKVLPNSGMQSNGPSQSVSYLTKKLRGPKRLNRAPNTRFVVTGLTGWSAQGPYSYLSLENMRIYWSLLNEYSSRNEFTFWLNEAFDNPWKQNQDRDLSHFGWWRLTDDKKANDASKYAEKIFEDHSAPHTKNLISSSTTNPLAWAGGGVAVTVIIITILVGFIVHLFKDTHFFKQYLSVNSKSSAHQYIVARKAISEEELATSGINEETENTTEEEPTKRSNEQCLEVKRDMLKIYWSQLLGIGKFGSVHKATLQTIPPREVALKTTKPGCPAAALRNLLSEIKILILLGTHPNIVSICGIYTAELATNKAYLVIELCALGSLKSFLTDVYQTKSGDGTVKIECGLCNRATLMRWSYEIACGMRYIGSKGVIHADLSTRNVLLTNGGTAKIADFGLSSRLKQNSEYVQKKRCEAIAWKWMAIESLQSRHFSYQSDVWSYGVTLWEIFSLGTDPYPGDSYNANFIEKLEEGLRMNRPKAANPEIYQMMLDCWNLKPQSRPSFSVLKERLLKLSGDVM